MERSGPRVFAIMLEDGMEAMEKWKMAKSSFENWTYLWVSFWVVEDYHSLLKNNGGVVFCIEMVTLI